VSISRIYRLLRLITLLQSGRSYSVKDLADALEVGRRTVFRDLNMLEMAHIPYYFDAETGGYRIQSHFFLPPVNLTVSEALAMLMMTGRLNKGQELPLLSQGARAAAKLESVLPAPIREHVGSVMNHLSVSIGPVSGHRGLDGVFDELADAITHRKVCRVVYISFHERKQIDTDIHPYRLVFQGRAWYVVGYSGMHKQVRTFKLGRIRKLSVENRSFKAAPRFSVEKHFGGAWGMIPEGRNYDVHVRFAQRVAGNVAEVHWHHSQQVTWNDDGSIDFRARVDGLGEISWWIFGYGDQAEVISPPALRRRLASAAANMQAIYGREAN